MKRTAIFSAVLAATFLVACDPQAETADRKQRDATEKLQGEAIAQVGMPAITNFQEMRNTKMLYELRDQEIRTFAYITDINGKPAYKLCDSVGYGLPYGVQFSNPQKIAASHTQGGYVTLPQPEPNGLFMPDSADGTWVMCLDPSDQKVKPVYVEPRVIVSPFPLAVQ